MGLLLFGCLAYWSASRRLHRSAKPRKSRKVSFRRFRRQAHRGAGALAANPLTYPADIRTRRLSFYGCGSAGPTVFTVLSSSKRSVLKAAGRRRDDVAAENAPICWCWLLFVSGLVFAGRCRSPVAWCGGIANLKPGPAPDRVWLYGGHAVSADRIAEPWPSLVRLLSYDAVDLSTVGRVGCFPLSDAGTLCGFVTCCAVRRGALWVGCQLKAVYSKTAAFESPDTTSSIPTEAAKDSAMHATMFFKASVSVVLGSSMYVTVPVLACSAIRSCGRGIVATNRSNVAARSPRTVVRQLFRCCVTTAGSGSGLPVSTRQARGEPSSG